MYGQSTMNSQGELESATNKGHSALSCYWKQGERRDLERSIEEFKWALSICPKNHPCRAAAQSNLAMAEFILCQVEDKEAELPIDLYRNALGARPASHVDRPSTLIQLAIVHFARSQKSRDGVDGAQAEALLQEAMKLSSADSHENQVAAFILRLHDGRSVGPMEQDGQSSTVEQGSPLNLTNEDLEISSVEFVGALQAIRSSGRFATGNQSPAGIGQVHFTPA